MKNMKGAIASAILLVISIYFVLTIFQFYTSPLLALYVSIGLILPLLYIIYKAALDMASKGSKVLVRELDIIFGAIATVILLFALAAITATFYDEMEPWAVPIFIMPIIISLVYIVYRTISDAVQKSMSSK